MDQSKARSSYRKTFGSQASYSTAGSKIFTNSSTPQKEKSVKRTSYSFSSGSGSGGGGGASIGSSGLERSMMTMKLNEKELLTGLNSRMVAYIDKVRYLEEQNQLLEKKIAEGKAKRGSELTAEQLENLVQLRDQVNEATLAKVKSEIERDALCGTASEIRFKLDHEGRLRADLDDELGRLRKDIDDANMVRFDLETKIETLREEIDYQKKMHEEEIEELHAQIREQGYNIEVDDIAPDISELLRQIRAQYEQIVMKNRDETESWYKSKFEDLDSKAKNNGVELERVQTEISQYRKQTTQLEMELESLKGTNEYLERNLADVEKRYEFEAQRSQARIAAMTAELGVANGEMKKHLAEYKRLMSQKISLEKEIQTYRQLLEGEEKRISSSDSEDEEKTRRTTRTTKKVIVKTIETRDGKIVSSSVSEKQLSTDGHTTTDSSSSSSSSSSSDEQD